MLTRRINPDLRIHGEQTYRRVAEWPYTRSDGSSTLLTTWVSSCAQCGASFEIQVPSSARRFTPNRRCSVHRRPGFRVTEVFS
jgi:hypothetical protein